MTYADLLRSFSFRVTGPDYRLRLTDKQGALARALAEKDGIALGCVTENGWVLIAPGGGFIYVDPRHLK